MKSERTVVRDGSSLIAAIDAGGRNFPYSFLSGVLTVLERAYSMGLSLFLASENVGLRKRTCAPVPVISIGNLSVGGTGKTPATVMLSRHLQAEGLRVCVLTRGHGGTASGSGAVVSDNNGAILLSTSESGDEPMVLALALPGIPVLVGKDRRKAVEIAVHRFKPDVLILDDGYQYWQLKRDIDIVLIDGERPFHNGHCLPRGMLREPKENLNRASIVLISRSSRLSAEERRTLKSQVAELAPHAVTYFSHHAGNYCIPANAPAMVFQSPLKPLALCAIEQPKSFLDTLNTVGITPAATMFLPDHHLYSDSDIVRIVEKMKCTGAQTVVTTQKDFVKLDSLVTTIPIFVQPLDFNIEDKSSFIAEVFRCLSLPNVIEPVQVQPC